MVLEDRGDRLAIRGGGRYFKVPFTAVAATAVSASHLVIAVPPETVIVPRSAFARQADLFGLVERIEAALDED
jgi:hypothetical protein